MDRDADWIWEALALGEESLLMNADIDYFDWNGSHEKYGTPLIGLIVGKATGQEVYDFATGTPEKLAERLNLLKLVLSKGASPHAKPPPQFSICKSWWKTEGDREVENSRTPLVHFNDKSAYGVVAACIEALTNVEGDWRRELAFLRDAARILASYRPSRLATGGVSRVFVAEGAVDTWERLLTTTEGADVIIVCTDDHAKSLGLAKCSMKASCVMSQVSSASALPLDASAGAKHNAHGFESRGQDLSHSKTLGLVVMGSGPGGVGAANESDRALGDVESSWPPATGCKSGSCNPKAPVAFAPVEIRAHSVVLRNASKVLRAMLSPSFQEGRTAKIELQHDASAVRLILTLLYVGEEPDDSDISVETLLNAVELGHQWDVGYVVAMLEAVLVKRLHDETFILIAETAARLQLAQLAPACVQYAKTSEDVKARFKTSRLPLVVQTLLKDVFSESLPHATAVPMDGQRRKRLRYFMTS
eukprot:TRINITY_DN55708_c0_g1_i1.p1 TRINITY_DN55708_c0_g1~~TRINITY_DN55708_c0_g1_i1.p1  ORF type:complete len:476 (+),score=69.76 TRINITY_DN55708_c0_g1_i1:44-1471(+)